MKKKLSTVIIAAAVTVMMALSLVGCSGDDPSGLVKANLDYLCTGELTEEILETANGQSEEDLKNLYKADLDETVDELIEALDCEAYAADEKRAVVEDFIKAAMKKAKYEVSEEYTEKDDVYYVPVTVYPMDFMQSAGEYIEGEFIDSWEKKILDGTYTFTTEEQLAVDMYDQLFDYLMKAVETTGYLDGVEIKVAVEKHDDMLEPNEDDLAEVGAAMLGE